MKISKMAVMSSTVMLAVSLTGINSNASVVLLEKNSDNYQKYLDGYEPIEDGYGLLSKFTNYEGDYQTYVKNENDNYKFKVTVSTKNSIEVKFSETSAKSEISDIIKEFGYDDFIDGDDSITISENWEKDKSEDVARDLCSMLKDKGLIESFDYSGSQVEFVEPQFKYLTAYIKGVSVDNIETLENYVAEKNLDCKVIEVDYGDENWNFFDGNGYDYYIVVPDSDISTEEHFELAGQIYEDLNVIPAYTVLDTGVISYGDNVDMLNETFDVTLAGDVNLDNKVDIADAVVISAYIGDPEKNFIREQRRINGDVHSRGDGLNANDVLMIQQYLSGSITEL